jgi:hypothetical protein
MSQIKITCAFCNTTFKVTPREEARQVDCPKCQMPITVPAGKPIAIVTPAPSVFVPVDPVQEKAKAQLQRGQMPRVAVAPDTPAKRYRRLRDNIRILMIMLGIPWHLSLLIHGLGVAFSRNEAQGAYHLERVLPSLTGAILCYVVFNVVGWMECLEPRESTDSADRS